MGNKGYNYTRLFEKNGVVFDIPSDAFNQHKIDIWFDRLEKTTAQLSEWSLLSIPDETIGVTPEAATRLVEKYSQIKSKGCKVICIQSTTTASKILIHALDLSNLHELVIVDSSIERLCSEIESRMTQPRVLNQGSR